MSVFRVEFDGSFNSENDAISFLNLLQEIKNKLFIGTGNEPISNITKCRYHECFHDEIPPKQCKNYVNYDLKSVNKEEVLNKAGDKVDATVIIADIKPTEVTL